VEFSAERAMTKMGIRKPEGGNISRTESQLVQSAKKQGNKEDGRNNLTNK
jgi:hypothetical protein